MLEKLAEYCEPVADKTDRESWLKARKAGLGSSDAAAILGLSHFKSGMDVYYDKVTDNHESPPNWRMVLGRELEDPIARLYTWKTGTELIDTGKMYRSKKWPFALATPDRFTPEGKIVEIKASWNPYRWGEQATDEIPEEYIVQVQHQMAVTGAPEAIVVVLIGGEDLREYTVVRDDTMIEAMMKLEKEFWEHVERKEPPGIWEEIRTRSAAAAILEMNPPSKGKVEQMDDAVRDLCLRYREICNSLRALEKEKESVRAEIAMAMGDATRLIHDSGVEVIRKKVSRGQYVVRPTTYETIQIVVPEENHE